MIRLTIPSIEEDDLEAVKEVLESGYLVQGERVAAFEKVVADYVGTEYAVAVSIVPQPCIYRCWPSM